jgi:hypothetical protein
MEGNLTEVMKWRQICHAMNISFSIIKKYPPYMAVIIY